MEPLRDPVGMKWIKQVKSMCISVLFNNKTISYDHSYTTSQLQDCLLSFMR